MPEKILVVDDDPMLSELVAYNLQAEGYEVVKAGDGQEGLRQFYAERPDLVILDVAMPKLDGYQVCQTNPRDVRYTRYYVDGQGPGRGNYPRS